jgi:hypothetical protein
MTEVSPQSSLSVRRIEEENSSRIYQKDLDRHALSPLTGHTDIDKLSPIKPEKAESAMTLPF